MVDANTFADIVDESRRRNAEKSLWISVKDRLPEKSGRYLVVSNFCGHILMFLASWTPNYSGFEEHLRGRSLWYAYDSECGDYEVSGITHWMPLPPAPKEEETK